VARTIAKDHDEKRALIRKAAAKVFAQQGFDRASMSMLAREAGISKANIYHYYDGKDALLFDLLDSKLSGLLAQIEGVGVDGLRPEDALRKTITETLLAYEGEDYEHQVQTTLLGVLPEEQQSVLLGYQRAMVRRLSALVAAVAPDGVAGDRGKLHSVTMSIFGMLNWFYMWKPGATAEDRREYADLVTDLVLKGAPEI
jgi:AcrR family transcriptional regulator